MHRGRFKNYTKEEEEALLYYMRDLQGVDYGNVSERSKQIVEKFPGRTSENIRKHWYQLIGGWKDDIKDVADLLSPEQRKRFKVRLPSFKNYIDPRTGRRV